MRRRRRQVVLTKRKDDEDTSSTIYNAMEHVDPVLNFQKYIDDDENIVDEVCNWHHLTLGQLTDFKTSWARRAGYRTWQLQTAMPVGDRWWRHQRALLVCHVR